MLYSLNPQNESKIAKSIGKDLDISFRKAVEVCNMVQGMKLVKAIEAMEAVVALQKPVPFKRFTGGTSHHPGAASSKYPKKAATETLKILKNALANAEYKGLDTDKLNVIHIQANKGPSRRRRKPKGRWKAWKTQYVVIQAIVKEK